MQQILRLIFILDTVMSVIIKIISCARVWCAGLLLILIVIVIVTMLLSSIIHILIAI